MNRDAGRYPHIIWYFFRYGARKFEYRFEQQRWIDDGQHYGWRSRSGPRSSCALGSSRAFVGQSFVFADRHFFQLRIRIHCFYSFSTSHLIRPRNVASGAEDGTIPLVLL
jgi:hypothetical protein